MLFSFDRQKVQSQCWSLVPQACPGSTNLPVKFLTTPLSCTRTLSLFVFPGNAFLTSFLSKFEFFLRWMQIKKISNRSTYLQTHPQVPSKKKNDHAHRDTCFRSSHTCCICCTVRHAREQSPHFCVMNCFLICTILDDQQQYCRPTTGHL